MKINVYILSLLSLCVVAPMVNAAVAGVEQAGFRQIERTEKKVFFENIKIKMSEVFHQERALTLFDKAMLENIFATGMYGHTIWNTVKADKGNFNAHLTALLEVLNNAVVEVENPLNAKMHQFKGIIEAHYALDRGICTDTLLMALTALLPTGGNYSDEIRDVVLGNPIDMGLVALWQPIIVAMPVEHYFTTVEENVRCFAASHCALMAWRHILNPHDLL